MGRKKTTTIPIRCGSFDYTPNQLSRRFGARFRITLLEYGRTLHSRRQDRERELQFEATSTCSPPPANMHRTKATN